MLKKIKKGGRSLLKFTPLNSSKPSPENKTKRGQSRESVFFDKTHMKRRAKEETRRGARKSAPTPLRFANPDVGDQTKQMQMKLAGPQGTALLGLLAAARGWIRLPSSPSHSEDLRDCRAKTDAPRRRPYLSCPRELQRAIDTPTETMMMYQASSRSHAAINVVRCTQSTSCLSRHDDVHVP